MLSVINILLGAACNRKCKFCVQALPAERACNSKGDVEIVLKRLALEKEQGKTNDVQRIQYWGGEPMLYFETVKKLYEGISSLGIKAQEFHRFTTNGDLISDEYVEWANSHDDVQTVVSWHDGTISESQWDKIFKLKRFCVCALITHDRPLPWKIQFQFDDLCERYQREVAFSMYPVHAAGQCDPKYFLTKEDVDLFFAWLETVSQDSSGSVFINSLVSSARREANPKLGERCCGSHVLSIDMKGNTYDCPHNPTAENRTENCFERWKEVREKCRSCLAWDSCRGGCWLSHNREVECYYEQRLAKFKQERVNEAEVELSN